MWGSLIAAAIMLRGNYHKAQAQCTTAQNGNDVHKTNAAGKLGIGNRIAFLALITAVLSIGLSVSPAMAQATNVFNSTGNAGIGTTTPGFKLEIVETGNVNNPMVQITNSSNGNSAQAIFKAQNDASNVAQFGMRGSGIGSYGALLANDAYVYGSHHLTLMADYASGAIKFATGGNSERVRIDASGNLGVGTTTPGTLFGGVSGSGRILQVANSSDHAQLWVTATGSGKLATVTMEVSDATASKRAFQTRFEGSSNAVRSFFFNEANGAVTQDNVLVLNNDGNVGIGTSSPQYKLDVAGNINSSATITGINIVAKYQDVAEWVPSSEQIPAGTVVVLDTTKSNQVISSTQSYDPRVAGVISEQPGIALGEGGSNKVLVATTGRVLVKVDASRAAGHIGDLLVTSNVPGAAMKSEPINIGGVQLHRPGTLIGKALEPLEKGSGRILVLLSLQ